MISFIAKCFLMVGSPFAFLSVLVMIARWFPNEKFVVLADVGQLFSTVGILIGGTPLALLIQYYLSWRVVMIILGTAGVICNYIVQGTLSYLGSGQGGRFFLPDYRIAQSILPIFLFIGVFIALFFLKDKKVTQIHSEGTSKEKK